ncbi:MAG TPA: energy transducer TonB [Verrucomicrobiae bacterium]|nr:energy transducer TonB [Verrucomicrobiae bacterium]
MPQHSGGQRGPSAPGPSQRRLMLAALSLLLLALVLVLYRDRDFWFPDTDEADDQELSTPAGQIEQPQQTSSSTKQTPTSDYKVVPSRKRHNNLSSIPIRNDPPDSTAGDDLPFATVTQRTALPSLQVEVVAGDVHKTIKPGTNAVHVELQPGSQPQPPIDAPVSDPPDPPVSSSSNASEHVKMSANTVDVVSRPVNPGYPLLARQMKVQGSVILEALIGRDGLIQNLHVVSGPPILADAAQEAVKQWHFKPHYEGTEPVETQARITVNFTISTN